MRYNKLKFFISLLAILSIARCSSGGGSSATATTTTYDVLMLTGCSDGPCTTNSLYVLDSKTGSFQTFSEPVINLGADSIGSLKVGDLLYFSGISAAEGSELWVLDTTQDFSNTNPQLVYDINSGSANSSPQNLTKIGSKIYFTATTASEGSEMWVLDPAQAYGASNPQLVVDYKSGTDGSYPYGYTLVGDKIIYTALSATVGSEMTVYDPSQPISGTNPISADIASGIGNSYPFGYKEINNKVYFCSTIATGREVYEYDPTQAISGSNPSLIVDNNGAGHGCSIPLDTYNNKYYYIGISTAEGQEIFVYDPSQATSATNPGPVVDFNSGAGYGVDEDYYVLGDEKLYFVCNNGSAGYDLCVFDFNQTVSASNPLFIDINTSGSSDPTELNYGYNILSFAANDGSNGSELWIYKTDEAVSASNPYRASDINPAGSTSFDEMNVMSDGKVYFYADDGTNTAELYVFDTNEAPSATNPQEALSISGSDGIDPFNFTHFTYTE